MSSKQTQERVSATEFPRKEALLRRTLGFFTIYRGCFLKFFFLESKFSTYLYCSWFSRGTELIGAIYREYVLYICMKLIYKFIYVRYTIMKLVYIHEVY